MAYAGIVMPTRIAAASASAELPRNQPARNDESALMKGCFVSIMLTRTISTGARSVTPAAPEAAAAIA